MIPERNHRFALLLRPRRDELARRISASLAASWVVQPQWLAEEWADASSLLLYLIETVALDDSSLMADYLAWASTKLVACGLREEYLQILLRQTADTLGETLPATLHPLLGEYLRLDPGALQGACGTRSFIQLEAPLGALARQYLDALLRRERQRASQLVLDAVRSGVDVRSIYLHVFQVAQREVGRLYQLKQATVAEEHFCTAATQLALGQLSAYVFGAARSGPRVVAAAVGGESHDIGIRMVADFFELEGWDTFYLGPNTPSTALIEAVQQHKATLLALSVSTSFRVGLVAEAIAAVRAAMGGVRILVGGQPFLVSPELWRRMGADGCASDAQEAVRVARRLLERAAP